MTTRQLLVWQRSHARRAARARGVAKSRLVVAIVTAGSLALLVAWRGDSDVTGASQAWLGATLAMFAVVFLRVPTQVYWRPDASLLAQLPIRGSALADVALMRCAAAAGTATVIAIVGALPLLALDADRVGEVTRTLSAVPIAGDPVPRLTPTWFFVRHAALASALGVVAAAWIPAVTIWSASLVATGRGRRALRVASVAVGSNDHRPPTALTPNSDAAVLGAVPGAAASVAIVVVLLSSPWLHNRDAPVPAIVAFAAIAAISIGCLLVVRIASAEAMPAILREMSSLGRHQLATLEMNPPTALERSVASILRASAVVFRKDARLMRRRYPMAFALGALAFVVLTGIGLARPDSRSWLTSVLVAAAAYAIVLAGRVWRPPIELPRLTASLPFSTSAPTRAKLMWLAMWLAVFVAVPTIFAILRWG